MGSRTIKRTDRKKGSLVELWELSGTLSKYDKPNKKIVNVTNKEFKSTHSGGGFKISHPNNLKRFKRHLRLKNKRKSRKVVKKRGFYGMLRKAISAANSYKNAPPAPSGILTGSARDILSVMRTTEQPGLIASVMKRRKKNRRRKMGMSV